MLTVTIAPKRARRPPPARIQPLRRDSCSRTAGLVACCSECAFGPICEADTLSCSAEGEGEGASALEPAPPSPLTEEPLLPEEGADDAEAEGTGVADEREVSEASAEGVTRGDGDAATVEGALADASLAAS